MKPMDELVAKMRKSMGNYYKPCGDYFFYVNNGRLVVKCVDVMFWFFDDANNPINGEPPFVMKIGKSRFGRNMDETCSRLQEIMESEQPNLDDIASIFGREFGSSYRGQDYLNRLPTYGDNDENDEN